MLCEILQVGELRKCAAPRTPVPWAWEPGETRGCSVRRPCGVRRPCDWTAFLGFFFNH